MAFSPSTWQPVITASTILLAWAAAASGHGVDVGDMLMMDRFLIWQATHNRSYPSAEERLRRFRVYRHNVEYIDATNRRGDLTYQLGENQFADITREEFLAKFTSYIGNDRTDDDGDSVITTAVGGGDADLWSSGGDDVSLDPPSVDWRAKGAVVPPKNQSSSCSSSWAFVAVATIESLHAIKTGKLVVLSEQQLVDCDQYDGGCNRGTFRRAFHWVIQNGGLTTAAEYPYTAAQVCDSAKSSHHVAAITGHASVPGSNELAMKHAVATQPVAAAIELGSDMQFYKSGVYSGPCGTRLEHAVTVVGYGADESTGDKYWIVKNSWGQTWGERGYVRMQRKILGPGLCGIMLDVAYPTMS